MVQGDETSKDMSRLLKSSQIRLSLDFHFHKSMVLSEPRPAHGDLVVRHFRASFGPHSHLHKIN